MTVDTAAPSRTARDVMRSPISSVLADTPLAVLADLMHNAGMPGGGVSGMAVVDGAGNLLGLVTRTAVERAAAAAGDVTAADAAGDATGDVTAASIMRSAVCAVTPGTRLNALVRFFALEGVEQALVVEAGRAIGVVCVSDVVHEVVARGDAGPVREALDPEC